jgi:hypothetical protein
MKPGNAGGGKGPQLKGNARSDEDGGIDVSLTTPESVQKLQTALHDKAKGSPNFRFYALYDKVYRKDVLAFAYERCKANGGAAGVDGQTFEDIEAYTGRNLHRTGQLRSHMIAGVCVEPLFQGTRCQAQSLAPCRHFDGFEIQVGDRLAP